MRNLFLSAILILTILLQASAEAATGKPLIGSPKRAVALKESQISFEFATEDGEINYSCTQKALPGPEDLAVTCISASNSKDVWKFEVHLRLFMIDHMTQPKRSYELLYWVTDEKLVGGKLGEFTGSTMSFNLDEHTPLSSLDAGQSIENAYVLTAHVVL